jgi:hypothetical protein
MTFSIVYCLGIITGILISVFFAVLIKRNEVVIVRKLLQANKKISTSQKEKVEFFDPTDEKVEAFTQIIKENDEKGIDTKI